MNTTELSESSNAGNRDPLNVRYKANGKRITREQFDMLKHTSISTDCFYVTREMGVETFYCTVRHAHTVAA